MTPDRNDALARRHLRIGWWMFFAFLLLGAVLEALHGFKVIAYLGSSAETRRLLWTLAHAHGTLFGLAHVALGATIRALPDARWADLESVSFTVGSALVPCGFFLGGAFIYDGDPGLGIALVPIGIIFIVAGAGVVAWRTGRGGPNLPA